MEIRVGPLSVTMHHGESFLVSEPDASIRPGRKQGYFVEDTRLVSRYAVDLCEVAPLLVNSGAIAPHAARYEFVNARMQTPAGPLDPGQLHLRIDRAMGPGLPEDYELTNYSCGPVTLDLTVRIEGDYADLMDVKARTPLRRGTVSSRVEDGGRTRTTRYRNQDFARGLRLEVPQSDTGPEFAEGTLSFRIHLGSHQHWHGCVLWRPILGDELLAAPSPCHQVVTPGNGRGAPDAATRIVTSDPSIDAVLDRSLEDLTALRLHRYDHWRARIQRTLASRPPASPGSCPSSAGTHSS